jgi:hypothetical protein
MEEDKVLYSQNDFEWHKKYLDATEKRHMRHVGEPARYPCKVESAFHYYDNGPDEFHHAFVYQTDVTCSHCGTKKTVWQDELGPNLELQKET